MAIELVELFNDKGDRALVEKGSVAEENMRNLGYKPPVLRSRGRPAKPKKEEK